MSRGSVVGRCGGCMQRRSRVLPGEMRPLAVRYRCREAWGWVGRSRPRPLQPPAYGGDAGLGFVSSPGFRGEAGGGERIGDRRDARQGEGVALP